MGEARGASDPGPGLAPGPQTLTDDRPPEHVHGEDEPRFVAGDRIGRYVLLSLLGKGGMSVVYLAYDPELDRKVALKLMRVTMLGEKGKLRLQREAQALARLSHPNVVPVYDAGAVEDQAFVAMEFVEGKTLRRWLRGEHTWREKVAVMLDAGRGLAAAHAAGLIHRDFKPDNVLIGDDQRVRVLDFGLARLASVLDGSIPASSPALDDAPPNEGGVPLVPSSAPALMELTRDNQLIGTPAYMAPEQMLHQPADERADQFAFCVTLHEAVYGERPYEIIPGALPTEASTMSVITLATLPRVARATPRGTPIPSWIQRAIARGLRDDPAARWPSMDDLLFALTSDPGKKWRRLGVAALGLVALTAGGVALARAQTRTRALCHGGDAHVQTVWNASAREELASAFAKTGLTYASNATTTMTRALDVYARDWAAMDDDACAASRLRGEQSEEALDLRMACLSDRLKEMSALVDVVRSADVETVQQASRAAQSLAPLADCADVAALRSPTPRPRDPAVAAKVEELGQRLAVMKANYDVGKVSDAAKLGDQLLVDATPLAFQPLTARVDYWRGRAFAELGDSDKSIPAFHDAFSQALASRSDRVLRESAVRLAQEYIYVQKLDDFRAWADIADSAIARSGPDADAENFLAHVRCVAMWQSGAVQSRLTCLEKYIAKVEKKRPLNDWELVTIGLAATEAGELARGLDWLRHGYKYSLDVNGPTHPRTTEMRVYLCKGLLDYGDLDAALAECNAARAEIAKSPADSDKDVLDKIGTYSAMALRLLHRYDEARRAMGPTGAEGSSDVAIIDELEGHDTGAALATLKAIVDDTLKTVPEGHGNVVVARTDVANAELEAGAVDEARVLLEHTMATAEHAELTPFTRVDLSFTLARALWRSGPAESARAIALAESARTLLVANAPPTFRYQDDAHKIERWIRDPSVRALPFAVMDPAAREPW